MGPEAQGKYSDLRQCRWAVMAAAVVAAVAAASLNPRSCTAPGEVRKGQRSAHRTCHEQGGLSIVKMHAFLRQ